LLRVGLVLLYQALIENYLAISFTEDFEESGHFYRIEAPSEDFCSTIPVHNCSTTVDLVGDPQTCIGPIDCKHKVPVRHKPCILHKCKENF
jgi:hypothetical protein